MELALGPFLRPKVSTTLTKRLLYWILLLALPVFFFFFSPASTLGVCPLTLPARAKEPWTFPPRRGTVRSMVRFSRAARFTSSSRGELGPQLGDVGLGRDLHHVGLTAVNDQLHSRNL